MTFLYPEFIYLMLFPAALLIYLINTNKDVLERVFDERTLSRLRISGDALGRHGHNTLLFVVFIFMTLALARPVIEEGQVHVQTGGVDTVVALDLSASMAAADFYPDRLAFAKQKLSELLPELRVGRVALVGFGAAAFIVAPLTEDTEALRFLLRHLDMQSLSLRGTDLASALKAAAKLLKKQGGVLLLITDGGDEKEVSKLVALARKSHLRVAVWMMATSRGAPVPKAFLPADRNSTVVMSRANTSLKRLAEETGGVYVNASLSQADEKKLQVWFEKISREHRRVNKVVQRRIELFYYPLILALLFLPFALYSFGGRKALGLLFLVLWWRPVASEAGILDFLEIERGTKAYEKGDYRQSTAAFEKLATHLARPELWLDLGDSYYKSGRYKMACDAYSRVVTRDPRIESAKLYNLGNCYVRLGELEKALTFYKKVLKIWDDPDARYNLEVVKKALAQKKRPSGGEGQKDAQKRRKKQGKGARPSAGGNSESRAHPKKAKKREITPAEERKWLQLVEKKPFKTKLYPLVQPKEQHVEKPW